LLASRFQPEVACLLATLAGQQFIVPPELSAVIKLSRLPATGGIFTPASFLKVGNSQRWIDSRSLTDQIANPQTAASPPPSHIAGFLEKFESHRGILWKTISTTEQRSQDEAARSILLIARSKHDVPAPTSHELH